MNVLLFGMSGYPGGVENYIRNYFCHPSFPAERIHLDFVACEQAIAYQRELEAKGYGVYRVPDVKRETAGYYRAVQSLMRSGRYDAVYVNMLTAANALPVFLAKQSGIKTIILHAHASSTIKGFARKTLHLLNQRYCSRAATVRLACSEKAGEWLFRDSECTVIPNAIDCARFHPSKAFRDEIRSQYRVGPGTLLLGHVGRFAAEKNHGFLLGILKEALSRGMDAKLMLVGDGYTKAQIIRKAGEDGLGERVIFVGTSPEPEKYYPAFDVFLFPSSFEGFGLAALEAQSCGVPCIASDTLSSSLNVTGTVRFLRLTDGPAKWAAAAEALKGADENQMHRAVRDSSFNIEGQVANLVKRLEDPPRRDQGPEAPVRSARIGESLPTEPPTGGKGGKKQS